MAHHRLGQRIGQDHDLRPVMSLRSRLIAIMPIKKGGKVGYGGTWSAPEDMLLGVIGVGYGRWLSTIRRKWYAYFGEQYTL